VHLSRPACCGRRGCTPNRSISPIPLRPCRDLDSRHGRGSAGYITIQKGVAGRCSRIQQGGRLVRAHHSVRSLSTLARCCSPSDPDAAARAVLGGSRSLSEVTRTPGRACCVQRVGRQTSRVHHRSRPPSSTRIERAWSAAQQDHLSRDPTNQPSKDTPCKVRGIPSRYGGSEVLEDRRRLRAPGWPRSAGLSGERRPSTQGEFKIREGQDARRLSISRKGQGAL
jgi:hypothetical protein